MTRLMTAAAFAALIAGPVAAQGMPQSTTGQTTTGDQGMTQGATTGTMNNGRSDTAPGQTMTAPGQTEVSGSMTTPRSAAVVAATAGSPNTANGLLITPPGLIVSTNASGAVVIANPPIPDTVETRAMYGQPESNAGKARVGEGAVQSLPTRARARAAARAR